jgi:breast cancer 2 susceptibility protein
MSNTLTTDRRSSPSSRKRQLIFATDGEGDDEGSFPKQRRKSDEALRDDRDNPFTSSRKETGVAPSSLFTSASRLPLRSSSSPTHSRPSSPEVPPEPDYSSWFASGSDSALGLDTEISLPLFQSAKSKLAATPVVVPGLALKEMDQASGWIAPSETALKRAQEKMKGWQEGDPSFTPASPRPILRAVQNSASQLSPVRTPSTPTPSGFGRSSVLLKPPNIPGKPTPFKSPLLSTLPSSSSKPSTHASWDRPPSSSPFKSAGQHPLTSIPQSTPAYSTPARPMGAPCRPLHEPRPGRPKFVTPFKAGMRPGEAGRQVLQQKVVKPTPAPSIKAGAPRNVVTLASKTHVAVGGGKWMAFDTSVCLLYGEKLVLNPQSHTAEQADPQVVRTNASSIQL